MYVSIYLSISILYLYITIYICMCITCIYVSIVRLDGWVNIHQLATGSPIPFLGYGKQQWGTNDPSG